MNWLQAFVDLPPLQVAILKVTAVLGAGWCLHFCLLRASPRWRVLVWRAVMLGLVLVPVLSSLMSFPVAVTPPATPTLPPSIAPMPRTYLYGGGTRDVAAMGSSGSSGAIETSPAKEAPRRSVFAALAVMVREHFRAALFIGWILGAGFVAARFLAAFLGVRKSIRGGLPAPKRVQSVLGRVAESLHCS
ncbi:MAG TPA: hypothetical protein VM492_01650, partial [Sumerlaeia bacterium]|nr:hypothetical protein [Sumerlaeia bacterium]